MVAKLPIVSGNEGVCSMVAKLPIVSGNEGQYGSKTTYSIRQ